MFLHDWIQVIHCLPEYYISDEIFWGHYIWRQIICICPSLLILILILGYSVWFLHSTGWTRGVISRQRVLRQSNGEPLPTGLPSGFTGRWGWVGGESQRRVKTLEERSLQFLSVPSALGTLRATMAGLPAPQSAGHRLQAQWWKLWVNLMALNSFHKCSIRWQNTCVWDLLCDSLFLCSGGQKSERHLTGLKSRSQQACVPFQRLKRKSVSLPLPASRSWLVLFSWSLSSISKATDVPSLCAFLP